MKKTTASNNDSNKKTSPKLQKSMIQQDFYEKLASVYHLIFEDWDASMCEQGKVLSKLISSSNITGPILDCACGIGTQTIPLAILGYQIEGLDLSLPEIQRAKEEAAIRGLSINFRQDDMRQLKTAPLHHYDVVIAMDNALPHIESDEEITIALTEMKKRLKNSGRLLLSVRDYQNLMRERPSFTSPKFFRDSKYQRIVHQVWDWHDDRHYTMHLYITYETSKGWISHHFVGNYRAIGQNEVAKLVKSAGFKEVKILTPEETGYYQPIVQGRNP